MEDSLRTALQRSRQAVQFSQTLAVPQQSRLSQSSTTSITTDSRLSELKERLRNEEYLKATFQRLCGELKARVEELEPYHEEVTGLRAELIHTRQRREQSLLLEQDMQARIAQQAERIAALEAELRSRRSLSPLQQQNSRLKSALAQLQTRYDLALQARNHLRRCLI